MQHSLSTLWYATLSPANKVSHVQTFSPVNTSSPSYENIDSGPIPGEDGVTCECTECPETEYTECPETEYTECPEAEYTECPETEYTECPEAEYTECPETEYTECPEAECTECPETEPCASATNTTAVEQAHIENTIPTPGVCASGEGQQSRTDNCTAIGGGLGALAVVLALTLVGVVLGWVWHCRRNKKKIRFNER